MAESRTPGRSQTQRKLATRSGVWEHFTRFTDDHGNHKARCKRCIKELSACHGTSSLSKHVKICSGQEDADDVSGRAALSLQSSLLPCVMPRSVDLEEASTDLARMIALHGYEPSVVDDVYFRSFVRRLNPQFSVPSRITIEEMCDGIFDEARRDLFYQLEHAPGRVSLAAGSAKTIEGEVFYTACHFIDDEWNLHKVVMDAYLVKHEVHGPLRGVPEVPGNDCAIGDAICDISETGILDRLFMMASDLRDEAFHLQMKTRIQQEFSDTAGPTNRGPICADYVDNVLHSIARCLHDDTLFREFICLDVSELNLTRQKRQHLLSHLGLDCLWAYDEPWYSCYCSLEVLHAHGSNTIAGHDFTEIMRNVWREVHRSIQRISASRYPTSNLCLAELFKLREILQSELARASGNHEIVDVGRKYVAYDLREAKDILDKAIKNSYLVWSIPLVLDPRYKLTYIKFVFQRAFGSESDGYVTDVTRKIKELYIDYVEDDGAIAMVVSSADPLQQAWDEHRRKEAKTELDRYLTDCVVPPTQDFDILKWWKDNSQNYPTVTQMARDALAMPTCSKLSSQQIARVRSMIRGYSKEVYRHFKEFE